MQLEFFKINNSQRCLLRDTQNTCDASVMGKEYLYIWECIHLRACRYVDTFAHSKSPKKYFEIAPRLLTDFSRAIIPKRFLKSKINGHRCIEKDMISSTESYYDCWLFGSGQIYMDIIRFSKQSFLFQYSLKTEREFMRISREETVSA